MPDRNSAARNNDGDSISAIAWHALAEASVLEKLDATRNGLREAQVLERRREFGRNILPAKKPPTPAVIFLHQFLSPLIYILLAAGVVAILMGDVTDAAFIFGVVLLNAGLGTFQEWKAERSAASLQQLLRIAARVRRDGVLVEAGADELVPGDVVYLESGARVPADLRLLEAHNLAVDEALLTGESLAVEKRTDLLAEDLPISDRRNMAFAGSIAATGRGFGVVVATGLKSEVGKIARSVTTAETTRPPLVIRMERFAQQISIVVVAACLLLGGVAWGKGMPLTDVFFLVVALAVSAIPEGLPVAMTVALSIGTSRMAKRNVIVRKLTAVEGLGSCTYIASDKTGTLTINKQTVKSIWLPSDALYTTGPASSAEADIVDETGAPASGSATARLQQLARAAVICNEAAGRLEDARWHFSGDAVDIAFWEFALPLKIDPQIITEGVERVGEIPFESERSYAAVFFRENGAVRVVVKGAPEILIDR